MLALISFMSEAKKCRTTMCFELFSKLSAIRWGLHWFHVGGVNLLTLRPRLAPCWFMLEAKNEENTVFWIIFETLARNLRPKVAPCWRRKLASCWTSLSTYADLCWRQQMQNNTVFWTLFLRIMFVNWSLNLLHGGGLRWPTLKPKLACWAMPEAIFVHRYSVLSTSRNLAV